MAYAYKNLKVTWGGKIYGGADIWSNGVHVGFENQNFEFDETDQASVIEPDMVVAIQNWFKRPTTGISSNATLEWVKFAIIDVDGKYAGTNGEYEHYETFDFAPIYGGGTGITSAVHVAPQLTVALTLETAVRRGAARYGRIYPPLTGVANSAGVDANTSSKAASFAGLINNFNDTMNGFIPDWDPAVIVASGAREGRNAKVVNVKVGNVIDTQRRRRNAFVETYASAPVAGFIPG